MKVKLKIDSDFINKYGKEIALLWIKQQDVIFEDLREIEDSLNEHHGHYSKFFILFEDSEEFIDLQKEDMKEDEIAWRRDRMKTLERLNVDGYERYVKPTEEDQGNNNLDGYKFENTKRAIKIIEKNGINVPSYIRVSSSKEIAISEGIASIDKDILSISKEAIFTDGNFFSVEKKAIEDIFDEIFSPNRQNHRNKRTEGSSDKEKGSNAGIHEEFIVSDYQKVFEIIDGFIFGAIFSKGAWRPCKWDVHGSNCGGLSNHFNLKKTKIE